MPKTTVTDNGIEKISDNKSQKSAKKKVQTPSFLKDLDITPILPFKLAKST